ncbi:hypothetical protein QMK33_19015 [Hymenobacter sp. H14-R3]|uniref:hypothetical protein n=1 Tax=Hymenobacter sp. H14-R3 TaxID=3046308 RepID=UPI0024BA5A83|nr:hypothetical protein [Hymenobacter sp. H14-R3]MDJ0367245.1 hypothetical protein [Hymenobacter sp. H14-R3]
MPLFAHRDRLRADLNALAPKQEARVLQKFRLEWNYHSNAIEGNSLTLGETRSLLHGLTAAGKPKLVQPGRYKSSPNKVLTATNEMFCFASPEEASAA